MKVCRNLIVPFLVISFLSACSVSRNTQKTTRRPASPPADTAGSLTFIDGISIQRDGHSSSQKVGSYHSPAVKPPAGSAATKLQKKYAGILDVSPDDIDDSALFSFIDSWWGTPYRYGGESRNGIDCSAFVQTLYATVFGITSLPRTAQEQYDDSKKIKRKSKLKEGDLVFFRIHSRRISHVGIYLQNNKFVHASFSSGVMISDLTDRYWERYYAGGGEPKQAIETNALASKDP